MAQQVQKRRRVDVVVQDSQGNVLVGTDPTNPASNRVELPGGGIEPGESVEQAARRETGEESGIKARNVRSLGKRPTQTPQAQTYWRRATSKGEVDQRLGADQDDLLNPTFLPPNVVAQRLQQAGMMQANPERLQDQHKADAVQRAMTKQGHFGQGYARTMKLAGLEKEALMLSDLAVMLPAAVGGGYLGATHGAEAGRNLLESHPTAGAAVGGTLGGTTGAIAAPLAALVGWDQLIRALHRRGRG